MNRLLLEANEVLFVFGSSKRLEVPEATTAKLTIVVVAHGSTSNIAAKGVFLIIACAHQLPLGWVSVVTDSTQDHVVALLDSAEAHILHRLDEGERSSIAFARLVL